jgi:hypothetical protein
VRQAKRRDQPMQIRAGKVGRLVVSVCVRRRRGTLLHLLTTGPGKVFGCRPVTNGATRCGAGVRKPPTDETARNGAGECGGLWGFASEQVAEVEQRRCNAGLGAEVKAELSIWTLAAGAE